MPDWLTSMQQTFEYYVVDPISWKDVRQINNVKSCTVTRDIDADTLGSATIDVGEDLGECYVRVYLITIQNGITEKYPLGTFLVQTPAMGFDGKSSSVSIDAYTPLIELKENKPPLGYSLLKDENIMAMAYRLTNEYTRAPVVKAHCDKTLFNDFVSDPNETWLEFISDMMTNAKYTYSLDEMGRILFSPDQDTASLQPVWTYTDDNSSILYPEFSMNHDLYGIPNVVEVLYSTGAGHYYAKVVNDDPNSPLSTINRGREIVHRVIDPDMVGDPTENQIDEYAERTLRELSTLEYSVSYTHGYCPVRLGDCVRINYNRAGMNGVKAKVVNQSIRCEPGCPVSETAVFTKKLWR